jgi:hypothetical protein
MKANHLEIYIKIVVTGYNPYNIILGLIFGHFRPKNPLKCVRFFKNLSRLRRDNEKRDKSRLRLIAPAINGV